MRSSSTNAQRYIQYLPSNLYAESITQMSNKHRWRIYFDYYSIAIGVTAFRYDYGNGRVVRTRFMQIYASILNILVVAALPFSYKYAMHDLLYLDKNRLMQIVNIVNSTQQLSTAALIIITRWQRERAIIEIVTEMVKLERIYFDVCVPATVKEYCQQLYSARLFWTKYFSVFYQTISAIYIIFCYSPTFDLYLWLFGLHMVCVNGVLLHTILHYFLSMWYVWERFCWLNANLQRIFERLQALDVREQCSCEKRKRIQRHQAEEVLKLARAHSRIVVLAERFTNCYRLQIITVLINKVINNISAGYMGFKYRDYTIIEDMNSFDHTVCLIAFLFMLCDAYLLDALCEWVVVSSRETGSVLKRFQELSDIDDSLEYACNILSQQLQQHKLSINILGLIDLNKRLSFLVLGGTVKNILLLLQWDMEQQFVKD